ncbi:MAG TPA: metalloregulator ArsR/SmtB family transcription factor [Vicinamibacterales bacterium]|nr:metalloregulator ArsR/SmtB family transcription factor [Vicinamibacterales bacterium]
MLIAASVLQDSFSALADSTRCRMLWLLERQELTVSELCAVLQLPQSTVSRHLKMLLDAGWVSSRRDGTSRYYSIALDGASGPRRQLWNITRDSMADRVGANHDARRLAKVLEGRRTASQEFFATSAGEWDRLRDELFGREFVPEALLGLLPSTWSVADLGCGTGALVARLAPFVARVIGVDASAEMLAAARERLTGLSNIELRHGSLESLPIESGSLDAVTLMLVLHHVPAPAEALAEAGRVLKPGGRLLLVDMAAHEREEYRQRMGHVWLGFEEGQIRRFVAQAGLTGLKIHALTPSEEAKGPVLFAAWAQKPQQTTE